MSRSMPAPTWSASCSFRLSAPRRCCDRARPRRPRQGPRPARWRCRSTPMTTELAANIEALAPDLLQLHGKESPKRVLAVKSRFRLPVIKAIAVETRDDLACVPEYAEVADRLIFDARAPRDATRPGGLGKPFDWRLLKNLDPRVPFMLSGGLDAGQCRRGDQRSPGAGGVDVSSGVERAPGEKDPDLIRAFIRAARARRGRARQTTMASHRMTRPAAQFLPQRTGRARPFRPVRRPLRRRNADAADPRAGGGLRGGQGRPGIQARDGRTISPIMSAGPRRSISPSGSPTICATYPPRPAGPAAPRSISSATNSITPARTR